MVLFVGLTYWSVSTTNKTFQTCEILGMSDLHSINFKDFDSVKVAASTLYEANGIKKLIQGEQYRDAWSTPVMAPILFLDTLMGNVQIVEEGGGHQTHSLKLVTNDGTLLTLRSVTKDPSPLIPKFAETIGVENIVVDGISAQHPYAALVVAQLSNKANILNTRPRLVFLPKQQKLKGYNEKFGNRLFLLEYETEGNAQWLGQKDIDSIIDTEDLQKLKLRNSNKVSIDARSLVRARLFDLMIGDWDRHSKQWGWAIENLGDSIAAIPLPCDRDNAFFHLEGVLPTIISNEIFLPEVQSFEKEIGFLDGLVSSFDIYFMRDFPELIFKEEAMQLQQLLTDKAISSSFSVWPKQISDLDGSELSNKIIERRNNLLEYAIQFKKVIAESENLTEPLNGSEDLNLTKEQLACFNCIESKQ
tara:strand:+ start:43199 stop:44449 length:1251 start_codon:yes stop_codon:yes gene_type:complete